ncbi:DUF2480 family protein [Croceiramulus getboli]|nr:DUF2480 family protein [Flavobacteriaceae bacterium YJPT1-3]
MGEIVNRVAASKLVTFDLEEFYPEGQRVQLDVAQWLHEGVILIEKSFRESLQKHDWSPYEGNYVALYCSEEAILPAWAFSLVATHLQPFAAKIVVGTLEDLETAIYRDILANLDVASFTDLPVILKGCARKPVPQNAYLMAIEKLQPVAKSILFGEACSSVPLFKKKRS